MYDILNYCNQNNTPGIMLLIDFSKAFDSISHKYIENTMRAFNFCEEFIRNIVTCLHDFKSKTLVNGHLSATIELLRGCRQGNPIAAYLFILGLEILLRKLKASSIKPWKPKKGAEHLVEGYADDRTIILSLLSRTENQKQLEELI